MQPARAFVQGPPLRLNGANCWSFPNQPLCPRTSRTQAQRYLKTSRYRPLCRAAATPSPTPSSDVISPPPSEFTFFKTVMPADTDYTGCMWHGSYVRWMEESRVAFLTDRNIDFDRLVNEFNTDIPVRELNLRYRIPLAMGEEVKIVARLGEKTTKVRLCIETDFIRVSDGQLCANGGIVGVPVCNETRAVLRRWPPELTKALLG